MKMFMKQSKKGFTLIEMIVVIVIVAILAAIAVPGVMKYIDDAQDTRTIALTQPIFLESQVVTVEFYGKYGNRGTIIDSSGEIQQTSTASLIILEMRERFENEAIVGNYKVGKNMTLFFDDMMKPGEFDTSLRTHYVSKFGVMLQDSNNNTIFVVYRSNDEAKVFKLPEEKALIFDENSIWYCPYS